jgi:hypothetical protein
MSIEMTEEASFLIHEIPPHTNLQQSNDISVVKRSEDKSRKGSLSDVQQALLTPKPLVLL